jgi:hypothetical protein
MSVLSVGKPSNGSAAAASLKTGLADDQTRCTFEPRVPLLRAICLVVKSYRSNNDQPRQRASGTLQTFRVGRTPAW